MKFALLFGAQSYEHEISIVSAIALKNHLKMDLVYIFCDENRDFYQIDDKNMRANYFKALEFKKLKPLTLKKGGFFRQGLLNESRLEFDVCINLVHGRDGEDGKIAALLDFFGVSYIGPRLEPSVLSYSKLYTKYLAKVAGVKTLPFETITKKSDVTLNYPIIIKPTHLGSSLGIAVAIDKTALDYAKDSAFEYDDSAIIEPFIKGVKEYNLAGCKVADEFIFSIIEEPKKETKDGILSFKEKYLLFSGEQKSQEAPIDENIKAKIKEAFSQIYNCGFDGAIIRCDFFVIDDEVYINEINPNPGSLAYYLFDDFRSVLEKLALNLPKEKHISIKYSYLDSISSHK